jgi:hypothetical protein
MLGNGYYEPMRPSITSTYFSATEKGRENTTITDKLSRAMLIRSENDYRQKVEYKAARAQFGVPKDKKIPKGYDIRFNDGKHTWSAKDDWKPDTYFVVKGSRIVHKNLATKTDALKWLQDNVRQSGKDGKKRFTPPQLEDVQRNGTDYRDGIEVNGHDYIAVFGFRGGEFGNWMNQNDRQASLNFGYDALMDLADALCISDMDISYRGVLSIAFGARGKGSAVAHYEPLRKVINLTKMKGAGSLGHEWWHGFDDFLGVKLNAGGYLSMNPKAHPLMEKLIDTIKYKPETAEQAATRTDTADARTKRNAERWITHDILPYIKKTDDESIMSEYEQLKTAFLTGEIGSVDKLSLLKKRITGRIIPKESRSRLEFYESAIRKMSEKTEPTIRKVDTDYYRASKEMGEVYEKEGGYWESNIEMTARAFATYVLDKIPGRSDYLVGHAECAVGLTVDKDGNMRVIKAYPQGEERKSINAVFDELFDDLKKQQFLTHMGTSKSAAAADQVSFELDPAASQ